MFFNMTDDYFGKFNIYGEMSCYIEKILQICLDKLDLHVVSVIYHCYLSSDDLGLRSSDFSRKFKNYKILFT